VMYTAERLIYIEVYQLYLIYTIVGILKKQSEKSDSATTRQGQNTDEQHIRLISWMCGFL